MALHLYELTDQYQRLAAMMEDGEADPQAVADTLEGLQGAIEEKVDGCAAVIKSFEAESKALKDEADRLTARRTALENQAKSLKLYLEQQLMALGQDKIKTVRFTASIQSNPPSVVVTDEEAFKAFDPERHLYWWEHKEPVLLKSVLKTEIERGVLNIPGVELQQSKSLRIR